MLLDKFKTYADYVANYKRQSLATGARIMFLSEGQFNLIKQTPSPEAPADAGRKVS